MHRGSWKSLSSPRIAGVQCSSTVGSTLWGMSPVVAVVLGIVLDFISPNQRSRTRFLLGDGSGVTTCPRGGTAQHLWPRTRTPAGGSGTSTCHPDSRRCVRDLHVPSGLPQMRPGPPRAYPDPRELSAQLAAREGSGAAM